MTLAEGRQSAPRVSSSLIFAALFAQSFLLVLVNVSFGEQVVDPLADPLRWRSLRVRDNRGFSKTISSSCLEEAASILCSEEANKRRECLENFREYYYRQAQKLHFTAEQKEASKLILDLDALSVGSFHVGICNDVVRNKTLCTDRPELDLFEFSSWLKLFGKRPDGIRVLFAEHVLEHFHPMQALQIAAAAYTMLKPGGVFRVAVPDGYKPSPSYQQYVRPGGTASNKGQKHMVAWTVDNLSLIFRKVGFDVVPQEYFDIMGKFHTNDEVYKDESFGIVKRSFKKDKRNKLAANETYKRRSHVLLPDLLPGEPRYTSLWLDFVKPQSCEEVLAGAFL